MKETLEFIFSSFWVYCGTFLLIMSVGYSLSLPVYWYSRAKAPWKNSRLSSKLTNN